MLDFILALCFCIYVFVVPPGLIGHSDLSAEPLSLSLEIPASEPRRLSGSLEVRSAAAIRGARHELLTASRSPQRNPGRQSPQLCFFPRPTHHPVKN